MSLSRREILGGGAAAAAAAAAPRWAFAGRSPNQTVVVGVMGTGGRGTQLAKGFESLEGVEVATVCDVDRRRAEAAAGVVGKVHDRKVGVVTDFRRILDNKSVDVLVIGAGNHWHAPAAILACAAGKHVYVEKPCSHNPWEGETMVAAARRHKRHVQMGNQRRSAPKIVEAMEELRKGAVGKVYFSRSVYANVRPSIGRGKPAPVPEGLDFELWQGPAPRRPFKDNILHYNWHWFWHWGNGELGNNGVHSIDLSRWGLGVDYPVRAVSSGGRYAFDDDQETPDTHVVSYEFEGGRRITWEGLSCNRGLGLGPYVSFHGTEGTLTIEKNGYVVYDKNNKEVKKVDGPGSDDLHFANFLDAVRNNAKLNSEIEEGHKSTLLCHLGNIAHRTGRALRCDPKDGKILDDADAMKLWKREYEPGWEPRL
jgi:predicted dehydrogenase